MALIELRINGFRNLSDTKLRFSPKLNLVVGENGAGKTSLLEAAYCCSVGKSFRTNKVNSLLQKDRNEIVLFGEFNEVKSGSVFKVGLKRDAENLPLIKINGERVNSATELAKHNPVLVIEPETFELLSGGPSVRRRYLDWGVFHVEHQFAHYWRIYQKCLKQRNTLLRHAKIGNSQLRPWTVKLSEAGEAINDIRESYTLNLTQNINQLLEKLGADYEVNVNYYRGWERSLPLIDSLQATIEKDLKHKHTTVGPHRADLRIKVGSRSVGDYLSRGQQKMLICAMVLAQGVLVNSVTGKEVIYLVDDIGAELDEKNRTRVFNHLAELDCQSIITAVDYHQAEKIQHSFNQKIKMFHVEHGLFTEN